MIEKRFQAIAEFVENGIEGIRRSGLRVLEMRERYARALVPIAGNVNHVGIMYAGALFTLGEAAGGIVHGVSFDCSRFVPIVTEVAIRFRRPAVTDVTLEVSLPSEEADRIRREAEEKGKANFSLDLEIRDTQGEVVALVHGTWQVRKLPKGVPSPFPAA